MSAGASSANELPLQKTSLGQGPLYLVGAFLAVLLALAVLLIAWRIEAVMLDLAQNRAQRLANQTAEEIEKSYRFGLSLSDMTGLQRLLERKRAEEPAIRLLTVVNEQGAVVGSVGQAELLTKINPVWNEQLFGKRNSRIDMLTRQDGSTSYVGVATNDPTGRVPGVVWMVLDRSELRSISTQVMLSVGGLAVVTVFALVFLSAVGLARWSRGALGRLGRAQTALARSNTAPVGAQQLTKEVDRG